MQLMPATAARVRRHPIRSIPSRTSARGVAYLRTADRSIRRQDGAGAGRLQRRARRRREVRPHDPAVPGDAGVRAADRLGHGSADWAAEADLQDRRADRRTRGAAVFGQEARGHLRSGDEPVVDPPRPGRIEARPIDVGAAAQRHVSQGAFARLIQQFRTDRHQRVDGQRAVSPSGFPRDRHARRVGLHRHLILARRREVVEGVRHGQQPRDSGAWRWWSKRRAAYQRMSETSSSRPNQVLEAMAGRWRGRRGRRRRAPARRSSRIGRSWASRPTAMPSLRARAGGDTAAVGGDGRAAGDPRFRAACPANRPALCASPTSYRPVGRRACAIRRGFRRFGGDARVRPRPS